MLWGPETVISVLAFALLGVGAALAFLPVGTCSQCGHCKLEKLARQRERETAAERYYGVPFCAVCGRHHRPDEDHPI